ncbi:MAG TPA: hypothetical protein VK789_30360 [Bryobacteraceae bacterium]|jgi:hypothetical protein|nr:hypothetical protein [Bryobacteraceae bacterium]
MKHPVETDLALLAGGESGRLRRFRLDRHLRNCEDCQEKVAEFRGLREELTDIEMPDVDWDPLACEMQANIRVGLEAGACVREPVLSGSWRPRLLVAFASLLLVVGSTFFLTNPASRQAKAPDTSAPVLQANGSGIELSNGTGSFALLDRRDVRADQSMSAQGVMEARYINNDTGSVTITNVYLQQ